MAATYLDSGGAQEVTLQDLYNQIGFLLEKLEYGLITDSAKRLKVNVEAGTLPAVTTVTTVGTVTAVTTVSAVANQVRMGDVQAQRVVEALLDAAFIHGILDHISF